MMPIEKKRKGAPSGHDAAQKKQKIKKPWHMPKKDRPRAQEVKIENGDTGVWATCTKGREDKCVGELKNLFEEYAEKLYGEQHENEVAVESNNKEDVDIEAEIQGEINGMRKPVANPLVRYVRIDVHCVIFMKTRKPIEPVPFIQAICRDAVETGTKKTRFVQRLTPMTLMGKATEAGLEEVAKTVLEPHFSANRDICKKFAIRTTIRNHPDILTRDSIIKQVAALVGPSHKVDLTKPDLIILVEVYKHHCGMSVVQGDYEKLKRFNLAEIYDSTPKVNPREDPTSI